jgi:hypothetical protein
MAGGTAESVPFPNPMRFPNPMEDVARSENLLIFCPSAKFCVACEAVPFPMQLLARLQALPEG